MLGTVPGTGKGKSSVGVTAQRERAKYLPNLQGGATLKWITWIILYLGFC